MININRLKHRKTSIQHAAFNEPAEVFFIIRVPIKVTVHQIAAMVHHGYETRKEILEFIRSDAENQTGSADWELFDETDEYCIDWDDVKKSYDKAFELFPELKLETHPQLREIYNLSDSIDK